jgi:hypothetical protein
MITAVALVTIVSPFLADWNPTHIYNPHWTPHAKFHGGQTIALGVLTGALALWCLWGRRLEDGERLLQATVLASLYWITQAVAALTPGAAHFDPETRPYVPRIGGVLLNQTMLDAVVLAILLGGYWLARRQLGRR